MKTILILTISASLISLYSILFLVFLKPILKIGKNKE